MSKEVRKIKFDELAQLLKLYKHFYEKAGFVRGEKTGFVIRL